MIKTSQPATATLYLIYDGDCALCRNTAKALKIKETIGQLEIINARTMHPLVIEAIANGYDLNAGILVKLNDQYYYGSDAMHFLALISTPSDLLNKLNSFLFRSKWLSAYMYPPLKFIRTMLLYFQKTAPIRSSLPESLIQMIYGISAEKFPPVLKKRYANRPYSQDKTFLQGKMNITISTIYRLLSPLFRLTGSFVPYDAKDIAVNVSLISTQQSNAILMQRQFNYPNKAPYYFCSQIIHINNNIVIELMRFGLASRLIYRFENNKIIMDFGGYVLRLGKWLIPLPLGFLIGKFYAFEEAVSDQLFNMQVKLAHPLFGTLFQYVGQFQIVESHD